MSGSQPLRLTDFTSVDITVAKMGAGGFGLVFMGSDRIRGKWYALKTLRPELLVLHPELRDLFLTECLTWVGLWPHPNLLNALSAAEIDGRLFLMLDYAEGGSLRDLLAINQPFSMRLTWAQMIAAGLVALHTPDPEFLRPHPLVHRDLKPENVLVDASNYARITDFGLATAIGEALAQIPEAPEAFALIEHLSAQANQANPVAPSTTGGHTARATHTTRFRTHTATAGVVGRVASEPFNTCHPNNGLRVGK